MKKILSTVAMLAIMTSASLAMAASASGTIKTLDAAKRLITLDGGQHYVAEKGVDWSKLKVGEKVTITYQVKAGTNEASTVSAM